MSNKNIILNEIKIKLMDLKELYGESNLKITFNIAGNSKNSEKIKSEITEYM